MVVNVENVEKQSYSKDVTVANTYGLHARPAAEFVKLASQYECEVMVAKDIMGVMMLAAERGSRLQIRASGVDAREAVDALVDLVDRQFGEEGDE